MEITNRFDTKKWGIVLGIVLPITILLAQLFIKGYNFEFLKEALKDNKPFIAGLLTICLIVNGILFGILIQFKKQNLAMGLFYPSAVLGLFVFIYKVIL